MSRLLYGSIDLNKIDKTKVVTKDKNGNDFKNGAKYLNVTVWVDDELDTYGNIASVQMSQTKEEREQGQKATYIGNLKEFSKDSQQSSQGTSSDTDSLPF